MDFIICLNLLAHLEPIVYALIPDLHPFLKPPWMLRGFLRQLHHFPTLPAPCSGTVQQERLQLLIFCKQISSARRCARLTRCPVIHIHNRPDRNAETFRVFKEIPDLPRYPYRERNGDWPDNAPRINLLQETVVPPHGLFGKPERPIRNCFSRDIQIGIRAVCPVT